MQAPGARMESSPLTYELDGRQYVVTSSGGVVFCLGIAGNHSLRRYVARHSRAARLVTDDAATAFASFRPSASSTK